MFGIGGLPGWRFTPGEDSGGRRRGRLFGDGAPYGGRAGTALLVLTLMVLGIVFLALSCG